jgi:hypothetical protein
MLKRFSYLNYTITPWDSTMLLHISSGDIHPIVPFVTSIEHLTLTLKPHYTYYMTVTMYMIC